MEQVSHWQRAMWAFLFYTLVAPLLAALAIVAVLLAGPWTGLALPETTPAAPLGVAAVSVYLWAALPAGLAALVLVPFILRRGTVGFVEAAVAGVCAFAVALAIAPFPHGGTVPYLAGLAGLVSVAVRSILRSGKILL
jgi:hypothetical protein